MLITALTDFDYGHDLGHSYGMQQNARCIGAETAWKKRMATKNTKTSRYSRCELAAPHVLRRNGPEND
jgi:hypothetical protein